MFEIWQDITGVVHLKGSFVATECEQAARVLDGLTGSTVLDFRDLHHISSTGLGLLIKVQRRLDADGDRVRIINCNPHIREVFSITRFDLIFDLE